MKTDLEQSLPWPVNIHPIIVCDGMVEQAILNAMFGWRVSQPHDDVIKWKHFPRYWPFVRGIHRSPVNSPHKGQGRGALLFTLICRIND